MMRSLVLTIFCGIIVVNSAIIDTSKDKNEFLSNSVEDAINIDVTSVFNEVIGNNSVNYSIETHSIETDDGYIVTMHRIINKVSITKKKGIPVLLQHSYLSSSMDWLISGPKRALGFLLADAGYDVWLGNFRGNKYSPGHIYYNHSNSEYWNFSFHEMGMFDIPSMIDYILFKSSYNKLYYIGHGQAVSAFLVMASMKPAYNNKVARMFALAPIAFCDDMFSPVFRGIASLEKRDKNSLYEAIGRDEFHFSNELLYYFANYICNSTESYQNGPLCFNIMSLLNGFKEENIDQETLNLILRYTSLGGASAKQIEHQAQLYNSGIFQQFNNGPHYNLTKVTVPVTIFFSDNDWISSIDVCNWNV
ncbi:lipase 3-like [Trichogramma pretiosum]|uniref:lipase 3-like n=1 Tax=Trichogramma pretiosum TaxID=7493 RepID=UPI000C71BBE7|nr:lipase 3-like [Trichogramma pretiosum]